MRRMPATSVWRRGRPNVPSSSPLPEGAEVLVWPQGSRDSQITLLFRGAMSKTSVAKSQATVAMPQRSFAISQATVAMSQAFFAISQARGCDVASVLCGIASTWLRYRKHLVATSKASGCGIGSILCDIESTRLRHRKRPLRYRKHPLRCRKQRLRYSKRLVVKPSSPTERLRVCMTGSDGSETFFRGGASH